MKLEWKVIAGASFFLAVIALIYWRMSDEAAGSVMLLFGFAAYGMLGAFLLLQWKRRHHIDRPEDNPDGTYEEATGEIGYFPAASIWPAGIGLGAIFVGVALIYGNWYWVIGLPLIVGAVIGFAVEAEANHEAEERAQRAMGATRSPRTSD
jgi:hypothetical protein